MRLIAARTEFSDKPLWLAAVFTVLSSKKYSLNTVFSSSVNMLRYLLLGIRVPFLAQQSY